MIIFEVTFIKKCEKIKRCIELPVLNFSLNTANEEIPKFQFWPKLFSQSFMKQSVKHFGSLSTTKVSN